MSNLLADNLANLLTPRGSSRTLIITVGNLSRADDGAGPYIASRLRQGKKLAVIDAGCNPENIINQAIKLVAPCPDLSARPAGAPAQRIIFIDAADFGGSAGELRLIDAEHIPDTSLSTHSVPLSVISRILYEDTKAEIYFIGIQPKSIGHQETLSGEVRLAADLLVKRINEEFKDA